MKNKFTDRMIPMSSGTHPPCGTLFKAAPQKRAIGMFNTKICCKYIKNIPSKKPKVRKYTTPKMMGKCLIARIWIAMSTLVLNMTVATAKP